MRMIFVNLPVKDLEASKRFFGGLGFEFDPQFTDESAACIVIDQNIYTMLLTEDRFRDFIDGDIADPDTTEVLVALSGTAARRSTRWSRRRLPPAGGRGRRPWSRVPCTSAASGTRTATCGRSSTWSSRPREPAAGRRSFAAPTRPLPRRAGRRHRRR
jgi:uncharacterized protein